MSNYPTKAYPVADGPKQCVLANCDGDVHGRGLCNKHYKAWKAHGDPTVRLIRDAGAGTPHNSGYWVHGGRLRHVLIAEKALGRPLPKGAEVHHVDYDRGNDSPTNLVICPDRTYHKLLHKRTDALNACGHADWEKCWRCQKYDDRANLRFSGSVHYHPECQRAYTNAKRAIRTAAKAAA